MKPVQLLLVASLICLSAGATARFDDPLRALERALDGAGLAGGVRWDRWFPWWRGRKGRA